MASKLLIALFLCVGIAHAQDETPEIDYCKTNEGEIIVVGEGSPCPNGSWPL